MTSKDFKVQDLFEADELAFKTTDNAFKTIAAAQSQSQMSTTESTTPTTTSTDAVTTTISSSSQSAHPHPHLHLPTHRTGSFGTGAAANSKPNGLILPWDKFSYWVNAVLVVTFDIEMGQSLESVYPSPSHVKLTQAEKSNICYMSFPDSNSGFLGDTQYHFRLKQDSHAHSGLISNKTISSNLTNVSSGISSGTATSYSRNMNYDEYNRKTLDGLEVNAFSIHSIFSFIYCCYLFS
jgi:hypothetical protein